MLSSLDGGASKSSEKSSTNYSQDLGTCPNSEILKIAKWKSVADTYKRRIVYLTMRHSAKDVLTSSIN